MKLQKAKPKTNSVFISKKALLGSAGGTSLPAPCKLLYIGGISPPKITGR